MPKTRAVAGVVLAAALIGACGGGGDSDTGSSSATGTSGGERARSGATVSAVVLHSELGQAPPDMPERPPFPLRAFFFETRVITPPDRRGGQDVDHWPQESSGQAAYIRGRLCAPPCNDRRLWAGMTP